MESLGSFLREKRKSKGLSLEQVSEELRIKLSFLEALEEEKYELLPAPLYKRIFLKAYADYLGLNFEEIINKFPINGSKAREKEDIFSTPPIEKEVKAARPVTGTKGKTGYDSWLVIAGLLLGVMIILLFVIHQQIYRQDGDISRRIREARLGPFLPVPDSGRLKPRLPVKEEIRLIPAQLREMTLRLEGVEYTWATVTGDGNTLFAGYINNGTQVEYQARERFNLTLGKSLGVRVYINGKRLKPLSRNGKPVYGREINKDNYRDFLDTTATE